MAVFAVLCFLATASAGPAAGRSKAGTRRCGDIPTMYTWDVQAQHTSCGTAEDIAKIYDRRVAADLEHKWTLNVSGYRCVLVKIIYYGDTHRCTNSGGREITFRRGNR